MTLPITMLALIPMFVLMFTDFDSLPTIGQALIFAIRSRSRPSPPEH